MSYRKILAGLLLVSGSLLVIVVVAMQFSSAVRSAGDEKTSTFSEADIATDLRALHAGEQDFGAVTDFMLAIARERGGVYAFELLKRATLQPNIDLHLVGHVIGDELYRQQGLDGMQYCTHDFRNACSHTVVIGALLNEGMSVFDEVHEVCKRAPGGSGAYTMCFHGFGHGVLAYAEYEVPDAVELCERVGTDAYNNREYLECIGGLTMEMIGGVHDPALWRKKVKKYFDPENPLALCQADYMPVEAKPMCYTYITPKMFEAAGIDLASPDPSQYEAAFAYCDVLTETPNRAACYGGFGKEFTVLALNRDIREVSSMPDGALEKVIDWCDAAGDLQGVLWCQQDALNSLYWGGENEYGVSVRYCSLIEDPYAKDTCFSNLIGNVSFYRSEPAYQKEFCEALPETHQSSCHKELGVW